ncbi:DUF1178 family protein [Desulfosarcina sp. OttesenSCG-928-G10]|nr:DUF1178 family protein [Desulfosarcina sp. OttesenSCG-928-G10]
MIAYDLRCANGHQFEGWFDGSEAFEYQNENSLIVCPVCESAVISRLPSAFSIRSSSGRFPGADADPAAKAAAMAELGRQVAHFVEHNFENVGPDFATEALKMHYGVTDPRNIRGVSTPHEEEMLASEGIKFLKIPIPEKKPDTDPDVV